MSSPDLHRTTAPGTLGFEKFLALFAREFDLEISDISPTTRLQADLDFDSLELLRAACFMEMLVPFDFPDEDIAVDVSLADLYGIYTTEKTRELLDQ